MEMNNDNICSDLNGISSGSEAEFFKLIWNGTAYQMCLAKIVLDDHGAPIDYIILDINPAKDITRRNEEKVSIENDIVSHKTANVALNERMELLQERSS